MSKIKLYNVGIAVTRIDVERVLGSSLRGAEKPLVMLQFNGLYHLIPREIMDECVMLLDHRAKSEGDYSVLPPVTITLQQCIPIPGETAKILLEL